MVPGRVRRKTNSLSSREIPTNNTSDNSTIPDGYNFGKTPIKDPTKDGEIKREYPVKMVSDRVRMNKT